MWHDIHEVLNYFQFSHFVIFGFTYTVYFKIHITMTYCGSSFNMIHTSYLFVTDAKLAQVPMDLFLDQVHCSWKSLGP